MLSRSEKINRLEEDFFDILVIGGGVTGAGIALDAVSRGFNVALIDMQDFAAGSSSRSTKLIHGGLRYLKQLQFNVVYQTGRERSIAHKIAPFLVHPEEMLLPVIKGGQLSMNSAALALNIYDRLAGVAPEHRKKRLNKSSALSLEPLLPHSKLKGALLYAEFRTDDARLTIELIKKAVALGAVCLNYAKATKFIEQDAKLLAVEVEDEISKCSFTIRADHFVNACGIWTDKVWNLGAQTRTPVILPSKGIHLVFHHERIPIKHAIYFDAPGERMVFAIPRGDKTYVGTTDTRYQGDLVEPILEDKDVEYILCAINQFFEIDTIGIEDVISHWVGVRPLILDGKKKAEEVSRRDEIYVSENGLISITGGKLTGYRLMAKRTVDKICKSEGRIRECLTKSLSIGTRPFSSYQEVQDLIIRLSSDHEKIDRSLATYLVHNYGWDSERIIHSLDSETTDFRYDLAKAELKFTKEHEYVERWDDFAVRRTGWRYFYPEWESEYKGELIDHLVS